MAFPSLLAFHFFFGNFQHKRKSRMLAELLASAVIHLHFKSNARRVSPLKEVMLTASAWTKNRTASLTRYGQAAGIVNITHPAAAAGG